MQWSVEGANVETGEEVAIVIDAPSRTEAEAEARRRGMMVAAISLLDDLALVREAAAARQARTIVKPLANQSLGQPAPSSTPTYRGLKIAGGVLQAVAVLYYLGASITLLAVIYVLIFGPPNQMFYTPPRVTVAVQLIGVATTLFAIGGVCHGFSAGCGALRDIAINSFSCRS